MPLKMMFDYVDIDNQRQTKTAMFNLTQFEVEAEMELEIIQERFQRFQDEVIGDKDTPIREMTGPEKREILGMIKVIVRHAYGIREGKRFIKSQDIWDEFEQTGAFSGFLYWLFDDPKRANEFMAGIWPQGLDRPEDQPSPDLRVVQDPPAATDEPDVVQGEVLDANDSQWETKDALWDYTPHELENMHDGEFAAVKKKFSQGKNVPQQLLVIEQKRKARGSTD